MTVEEYIEKFKFTAQSGIEFISVKNARIALEIALKEEREKAANAFSKVLSSIGFSTPKWKELLSKDLEEILNENKEGKKDTRI